MKKLMITSEVSQMLRVEDETVRDWAKQGMLPSIRIGRKFLFDHAELVEFVHGLQRKPNP